MCAERHPAAVAAIVLVDGGPPLPVDAGNTADEALDELLGPSIARLRKVWPDRVTYHAMWSSHPAFADGLTPEMERYMLSDLVPCEGGFQQRQRGRLYARQTRPAHQAGAACRPPRRPAGSAGPASWRPRRSSTPDLSPVPSTTGGSCREKPYSVLFGVRAASRRRCAALAPCRDHHQPPPPTPCPPLASVLRSPSMTDASTIMLAGYMATTTATTDNKPS
jgi:hypothetical protein